MADDDGDDGDDGDGPRAYTAEEMRSQFLGQIRMSLQYWLTVEEKHVNKAEEIRHRMEGLVFSILVMLDGGSTGLPAFDLIPSPHDSDEQFHRDNGDNWWTKVTINECQLHEIWCKQP